MQLEKKIAYTNFVWESVTCQFSFIRLLKGIGGFKNTTLRFLYLYLYSLQDFSVNVKNKFNHKTGTYF